MPAKTHLTAVVLIPPFEVWVPIQRIRRRHDRRVRRWMPHVTLLYPFRPREEFAALEKELAEAARKVEPFEVELATFRHFRHDRSSYTLWLAPWPEVALRQLQTALQQVVPDCNDVRRPSGGFHPHLSVGQFRGSEDRLRELVGELQSSWTPCRFRVESFSLVWREKPPLDVFRVDRNVRLGP